MSVVTGIKPPTIVIKQVTGTRNLGLCLCKEVSPSIKTSHTALGQAVLATGQKGHMLRAHCWAGRGRFQKGNET